MDDEDDDDEIEHFTYDEDQVGDSVLSSVGLLGGENPEGEANSGSCQGGPFSALTRSMWPSKGKYENFNIFFKIYKKGPSINDVNQIQTLKIKT